MVILENLPQTNNFFVNINCGEIQEEGLIQVIDLTGKIVHSEPYNNVGQLSFLIHAAPGAYLVSVRKNDGRLTSKKILKN